MRLFVLLFGLLVCAAAPAESVRFIAFGDAGTGKPAQHAVGDAMARVCAARGCQFGVMLGDNFYPSGVTSIHDPQWTTKFTEPYSDLNVPVYAALGNHDNGTKGGEGNNNARGDVQVRYHYWADLFTSIWRMPARFYSFTAPLRSTTRPLAEFFALDSSPLASRARDDDPKWDPETYGPQHAAWLDRALAQSRAPWKIAFAHHPLVSNGLVKKLPHEPWRKLLFDSVCRKADLFLAGHDHTLQWLKAIPACPRTHLIISGAAAHKSPLREDRHHDVFWQAGKTLGFFLIELQERRYTVTAYVLDEKMRAGKAFELTVAKP